MARFFEELGLTAQLFRKQAALALAQTLARAIVEREITPYDGVEAIWRNIWNRLREPPQKLRPFVLYAVQCGECEVANERSSIQRRVLDRAIFQEA
jgi:hypothetical protein